ncbi:mask, partial [Symbiodinium sp. CCMP2456]
MGCTCSKAEPSNPTLLTRPQQKAGAKPSKRSLAAWELQLLHVSRELQVKLKDPHFVAQRCDLDCSGDLDVHELKQATRAFGFKFSAPQLLKLMAGQPRISKERFAEIVVNEVEAEQVRPSIPHSLRGMALGQLQHLEDLFINTGWLPAQCEAFNLEHADAIRQKKKFGQAANLYAMDSYVVTPMSRPGHCSARDQDALCSVPPASDTTSFSELVNAHGLIVHSFVSHFWGHLFSQTVTALQRWAEMSFQGIGQDSPKSVVFWICLFALNQHAVADEVGENPKQGPFNAALAQAESGAVMVLDEEINPFKRIWCLFEISRLKDLNRPFELICHLGSLSRPESLAASGADPAALEAMLEATDSALHQVSAAKAQASVDEDRIRIWEEIADIGAKKGLVVLRPALRAELEVDTEVAANIVETFCPEFDRHCQTLLSTAMLQFYLLYDRHAAAARCCKRGALFTKEQFAEIDAKVPNLERPSWLANLLVHAAGGGDDSVVNLLLDHGADVAAAKNNGGTALMVAAFGGHLAVAKLLLDHGADVAAADSNGGTALMGAAFGGHLAVAKLLLDHGA